MKKKWRPIIICITIMMSGCVSITPNSFQWAREYKNKKNNKKIIFLPMVHKGTEKYYDNIKKFLENKNNQNYTIYAEGVKYDRETCGFEFCGNRTKDSIKYEMVYDTLMRKFRKVVGIGFAMGNPEPHLDKKNRKKEVSQNKERMGTEGKIVDMSLVDLIGLHEQKWGKIELKEYDWRVPLGEKYSQDSLVEKGKWEMVQTYRNDYLVSKIIEDNSKKIVVAWGWAHMKPVGKLLKKEGFKRNVWYRSEK